MKMQSLTDTVLRLLDSADENPSATDTIFKTVSEAPDGGERDGLLALIYHEGIGVEADLDKSFEYAEKAAFAGGEALGYYVLGYMCDKAETPDQAEGGPRQKYDHYDAERFYEKCAEKDGHWKRYACNWLGDYYLDMARGGDPEVGVEYLEAVAEEDAEAAGRLSDHFWDIVMPDYTDDRERTEALFRWTKKAAELDEEDEEYVYRLGWLYADGIGCGRSPRLALKYFHEAYLRGDWRGAESIANVLEENRDEGDTYMDADIEEWRRRGEKMKDESDSGEPDPSLEED
ncbi:MAG: hypothetical protein K2L11_01855 [Muribaculaceae bacterium]|nr:hypothetical protein [Muribaculaceae bacterium]